MLLDLEIHLYFTSAFQAQSWALDKFRKTFHQDISSPPRSPLLGFVHASSFLLCLFKPTVAANLQINSLVRMNNLKLMCTCRHALLFLTETRCLCWLQTDNPSEEVCSLQSKGWWRAGIRLGVGFQMISTMVPDTWDSDWIHQRPSCFLFSLLFALFSLVMVIAFIQQPLRNHLDWFWTSCFYHPQFQVVEQKRE